MSSFIPIANAALKRGILRKYYVQKCRMMLNQHVGYTFGQAINDIHRLIQFNFELIQILHVHSLIDNSLMRTTRKWHT